MKKYGIDCFSIEILEECSNEVLSEREEFWIMVFNSYANGYNATKGGDGRPTVNYDLIYNLYNQGKTINEIATLTNYSIPTIKNALTRQGIVIQKRKAIGPKLYGSLNGKSKAVIMLDKNTEEELQVFESANLAQAFLGGKGNGHISAVCQGKRKTAYGYKWKYLVNK